jgi:hypothetical protein
MSNEITIKPCELPCEKCGHDGVSRKFVAQGERMKNTEYNRSPSKYATGQYNHYSATRDHLTHTCRCCGYAWQTLPMAKRRKVAAPEAA